jgi:hypothetical protein
MAWCADGLCPQLWTEAGGGGGGKTRGRGEMTLRCACPSCTSDLIQSLPRDEVGALRHDLPDADATSQVVVKDGWVNLQG